MIRPANVFSHMNGALILTIVFVFSVLSAALHQHGAGPFISSAQAGALDGMDTDSAVSAGPPVKVERPGYTLAILSDLHVKKSNLEMLNRAVEIINGMPGISGVALLGDLCEIVGSPKEYEIAKSVVSRFGKPVMAIPGNHDVIYATKMVRQGDELKKVRATEKVMTMKLDRFKENFGQKRIRFSKKISGHLLVFLPVDALGAKGIATISDDSLDFLADTLEENPGMPSIVFAHAPLEGSYTEKDGQLAPLHATAQPSGRIGKILQKNPQVFLWVAGHRHVKPSSKDFNAKINKVGKATVIHVPNVGDSAGWCILLELFSDKAVVKALDLRKKGAPLNYLRVFDHATKKPVADDAEKGSGIVLPPNPLPPPGSSGPSDDDGAKPESRIESARIIEKIREIQFAVVNMLLEWIKMF